MLVNVERPNFHHKKTFSIKCLPIVIFVVLSQVLEAIERKRQVGIDSADRFHAHIPANVKNVDFDGGVLTGVGA